jgi:phosphatidylserine/phosphatidylglycerophosphate/cardiolipin synthase-like enzyme
VKAYRYGGPAGAYHAKFAVADGERAAICTFNLTRRGFDRTCDFLLETTGRDLAGALEGVFDADAQGASPLRFLTLPEPVVLGPEWARAQIWEWLAGARRSIRLLDPRVSDPGLLRLLSRKQAQGVEVDWLAGAPRLGLAPHGRLTIVDDEMVIAGSCSLEPRALDSRRELAVCSRDPATVETALRFWRRFAGQAQGGGGRAPVRWAA